MFKLEASKDEHVIRSVGDPPNGILGIAEDESRWFFHVDPSWEPPREKIEGAVRAGAVGLAAETKVSNDVTEELRNEVTIEELVDGALDMQVLSVLWVMAIGTFTLMVSQAGPSMARWRSLRALSAFVDEVYVAVSRRAPELMGGEEE